MSLFSNLDPKELQKQANDLSDNIMRSFGQDPEEMHNKERGFDIIPQTAKARCGSILAGRRIFPLLLTTVLTLLLVTFFLSSIHKQNGAMLPVWGTFLIIALIFEVRNIRLFLRFLFGGFELFGGNITGFGRTYKKYNLNRLPSGKFKGGTPKEDRDEEFECAYVNGVTVIIDKYQSLYLKTDRYYYVIRIKHKHIQDDEFFFIEAPRSEEAARTGSLYPCDEPREVHPPIGDRRALRSGLSLGAEALIVSFFFMIMPEEALSGIWLLLHRFFWVFALLGGYFIYLGVKKDRKVRKKQQERLNERNRR